MKNVSPIILCAAAICLAPGNAAAQSNVNWTGGTGNWTNGAAWFNELLGQSGFLPSTDFSEIARIDGGGVVSVTTPLANGTDQGSSTNPGEIRLGTVSGAGELVIAAGGTLRAQTATSTDGGIEVGGGPGAGTLRVLPGGALTIDGGLISASRRRQSGAIRSGRRRHGYDHRRFSGDGRHDDRPSQYELQLCDQPSRCKLPASTGQCSPAGSAPRCRRQARSESRGRFGPTLAASRRQSGAPGICSKGQALAAHFPASTRRWPVRWARGRRCWYRRPTPLAGANRCSFRFASWPC